MGNMTGIQYKLLQMEDIDLTFLKSFNRLQETTQVWFLEDNLLKVKEDYFIDEWNGAKKIEVILSLQNCLNTGGAVIGAFYKNELAGFANVEYDFFGSLKQYIELPFIHVSREYRKKGIGKGLFTLCCEMAKKLGAQKLYIAAHPSTESQHFYRKLGCMPALEINEKIFQKEPFDIQLEFKL